MKSILFIFILINYLSSSFAQDTDKCFQKTQSKSDIKKLEPIICIPEGFHIVDIYKKDLNKDGKIDKVAEWFKEDLSNGDTIFHSIYFQEMDSTFTHFGTYGNLSQLYFDIHSQSNDVVLEDSLLNEIKFSYQYYGGLPTFYEGGISIEFYTDAAGYKKLFFEFSSNKNDFILRKEQDWLAPRTATWTEDEKLENEIIYDVQEGISIKDFNMLEYLE